MNSRSSVNESNLNLTANLSTLDPLDTKDSLSLSFPFDHIYACHSEGSDRRQTLSLDKDVEISTHCIVTNQKDLEVGPSLEINRLSDRLTAIENQNKKLKDLLVYHLDLIQQQNDVITKREKLYQALKQENDTLKTKVTRMDKRIPAPPKTPSPVPTGLIQVSKPVITTPRIKTEPGTAQVMFNRYTELLLPDVRPNPYIFNDIAKPKTYDPYDINQTEDLDVPSYLSDLGVPSILEDSIPCDPLAMIENKRAPFVKKDNKKEPRPEPLYTITSTSGNPVIQKIQRNRRRATSSIGSLNRMQKTPAIKVEPQETGTNLFDQDNEFGNVFSVNKKSKMINTYGKSKATTIPKRPTLFTGSLSDRLKLIDTTPTGEDPYQLGEADMREQSPIPKLMLQKTNHGRMRISSDLMGDSTTTRRRIYDAPATETSATSSRIRLESRYDLPSTITHAPIEEEITPDPSLASLKTTIVHEPDLNMIKTEPEIEWRFNPPALYDFGYGDSDCSTAIPRLNVDEFTGMLLTETSQEAKNAADAFETMDMNTLAFTDTIVVMPGPEGTFSQPPHNTLTKKRGPRTPCFTTPDYCLPPEEPVAKRGTESKRGRKRALSTTGPAKAGRQSLPKASATSKAPKPPKPKAACRGKKSPVPGMVSKKPYHTLVGDPDLSWYFGLDSEIKMEDIDQPGDPTVSTVEVPRWREKPYTSCYTLEGTENLDDKVFEKRHQKLEAEERRQLRWHMRRIREQRHMERLRVRHRESWCGGLSSPAYLQPSVYTIWPQPRRDVRAIEITDSLPVMAFGEELPELPPAYFVLPWVRSTKPLKRSKRSKTLH